jgi:WD40 repeat protein
MNRISMSLMLAFTMFLSSCSFKTFEPIPEDISLVSTINIKDMSISFYDIERGKRLPDWVLDRPYTGGMVLPDKDTLLLYGKTIDTADLYSLSKGKKIGEWDIGEGIVNGLLVQNDREVVFADQKRDSIRFFDLNGSELNEVKTKREPLTILEEKSEEKLYVTSFNDNTLSVIDLAKKQVNPGFEIHTAAAGAMLNNDKDELWIGGHGEGAAVENQIRVYDLPSGKLKKEIEAPVMPVNFIKNKENIYVLSHGSNMLYKLNLEGDRSLSLKVGANPFEMEFFKDKLIIAGYDSNDLYFVDPQKLTIQRKVSVGKGPFQIVTRGR